MFLSFLTYAKASSNPVSLTYSLTLLLLSRKRFAIWSIAFCSAIRASYSNFNRCFWLNASISTANYICEKEACVKEQTLKLLYDLFEFEHLELSLVELILAVTFSSPIEQLL